MDYIKRVNGLTINRRTRNEMNDILLKKGDWSISYYVPGRILYGYVVKATEKFDPYTGKRIKNTYEFEKLEQAIEFCKGYKHPIKETQND